MKLRYILTSILAVLCIAGCSEDEIKDSLDEVQVSNSYIGIDAEGGMQTITVTATSSWTINDIPTWLTVSPASGSAGQTTVTFSAGAATSTNEAELHLVCDGATQYINVIQLTEKSDLPISSCATVLAGADGTRYRIKGTVTAIANTTYGNFYINDGTGSVYIYGTFDASGAYNWSKFNIEVGDIVTVEGPKTTYSGTVELVDATWVSTTKSLLKVDPESYSAPKEGGEVEIKVVYKGNDLDVVADNDWLSLANIKVASDTTRVYIKVAENTGDPRVGTVTLKSSITGQTSEATVKISQAGVQGTLATPFTVAQAIDYCTNTLGSGNTSAEDFYVKGKVSAILYNYSASYGTATIWISDDGTFNGAENKKSTTDKAHDFECYSVYYLGNQKWAEGNAQLAVGDEVLVCGKLTNYGGTCETASKAAYVYSVNGLTKEYNGCLGNSASPFTVAAATAYCTELGSGKSSSCNLYVEGTVSAVLYTYSASYGTATFWISDDGKFNGAENKKSTTDTAHDFECYSVYYYGNQKWAEGNTQIAEGQKVTICGILTNYNGTSETSSKKAWVASIDGKSE